MQNLRHELPFTTTCKDKKILCSTLNKKKKKGKISLEELELKMNVPDY